ncbi:MAG: hypothetical protein HYV97_03440 [Bdellovibrio sp.]|nr:hypothetical protein [Bdellovibrio sp.]
MKPHSLGHFFKIVPLALSLILTMACGKKNSVKSSTPSVGTTVMGIPNLPATLAGQIQQIITSNPCNQGQRIPEIQLNTTGIAPSGNTTTITGSYNPGLISGPVTTMYVGRSTFNDIIVITKIANGPQVLGYNITVSMCTYNPFIMPGRPLSGFSTPMGLVLTDYTSCGWGSTIGKVIMTAAAFQNYPQALVETTFAPIVCNGTSGGYTGGGYVGGVNIPGGY